MRRRITLVELLVVVAIIVLGTALLVWAAQSAREAARRSACVNNFKQLVLGVQNYESVWSVLPPTSGQFTGGNDFSMKLRLIPFLEKTTWFYSLNQNTLSTDPQNWTGQTVLAASFLCPSDGNIPCGIVAHPSLAGISRPLGYTSYTNNIGTLYRNNLGQFDGPAYVLGKPALGPPVTLRMIEDGTEYTAMFSEWIRGRNGSKEDGAFQVYLALTTFPPEWNSRNNDLVSQLSSTCRSSYLLDSTLGDHKGRLWMRGNCGEGGGYSHLMPPNQKACVFQGDTLNPFETMIGASSNHAGGVNVGFIDGSVRFITNSITPATWRAISSYNVQSSSRGPFIY